MSKNEFEKLAGLLLEYQVLEATGYSRATLTKMVECDVLAAVKVPGCGQRRFLKRQIAILLGMEKEFEAWAEEFRREPLLMSEKRVVYWTGLSGESLKKAGRAKGLVKVRPAGLTGGKWRKVEVAKLIGLEALV